MANNPRKEEGLGYFNLARGLGMLIILFGHSLTPFMADVEQTVSLFSGWGTVFGGGILVMFFMISGYGFYKRSPKKCFSIQKKLLLYPYWLVSAAIVITKVALAIIEQRPFKDHGGELILTYLLELNAEGGGELCGIPIESVGVFWFILALFGAWNIYNVIMQLKSEKMQNGLVVGCVILGYLLTLVSKVWPFCIPMTLIAVGCMDIGHRMREKHLLTRKLPVWFWGLMIVIVTVSAACGEVNMLGCVWKLGLVDVAATFCIGFLLLRLYACVMKREWNGKFAGILEEIGFHSIWLFCIHAYEKIIFPWYRVPNAFPNHPLLGIIFCLIGRWVIMYLLYRFAVSVRRIWKKKRKHHKKKVILED